MRPERIMFDRYHGVDFRKKLEMSGISTGQSATSGRYRHILLKNLVYSKFGHLTNRLTSRGCWGDSRPSQIRASPIFSGDIFIFRAEVFIFS